MRARLAMAALVALGASGLSGCAVVDDFKDRIDHENRQTQELMGQETLLNIVRASRHEPLNFVAISQVSNTRMEDLKIGLPTITFGPKQAATQKQFVFSGNVLDSQVQASVQSNPLISTAFQQGMLTPVSSHTLAMLVATHGREPTLLAVTDEIEVTMQRLTKVKDVKRKTVYTEDSKSFYERDGEPIRFFFRNDPDKADGSCDIARFAPDKTGGAQYFATDETYLNQVLLNIRGVRDTRKCSAERFKALLQGLLYFGLTVDIPEQVRTSDTGNSSSSAGGGSGAPKDPKAKDAGAKNAGGSGGKGGSDTTADAKGRFCADPLLVEPAIDAHASDNRAAQISHIISLPPCLVGADEIGPQDLDAKKPTAADDQSSDYRVNLEHYYYLDEDKTAAYRITFFIAPRSPIGVFRYFGAVMRNKSIAAAKLTSYTTEEARARFNLAPNDSFFNVAEGDDKNCGVTTDFDGKTWCVRKDDTSTNNMLSLLEDLRNLSIQPSDLNASFSVRVTQ